MLVDLVLREVDFPDLTSLNVHLNTKNRQRLNTKSLQKHFLFFQLEWKDAKDDDEKDEEEELENKMAGIKLDMDENTKGIPKVRTILMDQNYLCTLVCTFV